MDANQLLDLYDRIDNGESCEVESGDITLERIIFLIKDVIEYRINSNNNDGWTAKEAELLTLVVESRDTSKSILEIFDALSEILKRNPSAIQYKYYTLQKRMEEGMSREQAWNSKRGKRGRGKKNANINKTPASDLLLVFPNNTHKEFSLNSDDDLEFINRFKSRFINSNSETRTEIMKMLNNEH